MLKITEAHEKKQPRPEGLCHNWRCLVKDQCVVVQRSDCLSYFREEVDNGPD